MTPLKLDPRLTRILAGAALLGGAVLYVGTVHAADAPPAGSADERALRMHQPSLGRMIVGNALVKELAERSGRPPAEIEALLKDDGPRAAAQTLGLDRAAMQAAMQAAHKHAILQAQQAQLISAEQARILLESPPPRRPWRDDPERGGPDRR
ncbi:hypothetical protein AAG565_10680 [Fontimonas sp. SYSU GA230001]|uniref:hypothetical protein n=1 Tax=Fontimonas sp. SYSU GA230001 TaxID=3142450 RepID=UPI0032B45FCE